MNEGDRKCCVVMRINKKSLPKSKLDEIKQTININGKKISLIEYILGIKNSEIEVVDNWKLEKGNYYFKFYSSNPTLLTTIQNMNKKDGWSVDNNLTNILKDTLIHFYYSNTNKHCYFQILNGNNLCGFSLMKKELDYLTPYLNDHFEQMMYEFDLLQKIHLMNDKNFGHLQNKSEIDWDRKLCNRFQFYKKIRRELDLNFRDVLVSDFKEKEIKLARREMEEREWEDLYSFFSSLSAKTSILKESIININDDYLFGFKDIFQNPNQTNFAEVDELLTEYEMNYGVNNG